MGMFVVQGSIIGVVGVLLGPDWRCQPDPEPAARGVCHREHFRLRGHAADVYYITGLPTELRADDVGLITVAALVMSMLATLYPAWRASRTEPAAALRYE